jgi:hypothetical protein
LGEFVVVSDGTSDGGVVNKRRADTRAPVNL